jgi:amidohydrolase
MNLIEKIKGLARDYHESVVAIRRHLHAYPELSFEEYETSAFVQRKLNEYGIPFQAKVAGTGIVALIEGRNPESKAIALRADMDALPIHEENDVPYRSRQEGKMHACGHDAHTASLLGAARILHTLRDEFQGTIKCIFQPGEERTPGGASLMIAAGVLENPRPAGIIGQHVYPLLPAGTVGFRPGMMMASCDEIDLYVKGQGGHGAVPHLAVDTVAVAAQIVTALQQLVSRQADPIMPSVLSFGYIQSRGGAYNVLPQEVHLQGTFRTFSEYWRYQAHEKIRKMAEGVAAALGAQCQVDITVGYPHLVNNEAMTLRCRDAAKRFLGPDQVRELPLRLTAEDFAYYTHHTRGCFYRLGTANPERGIQSPVHTPTFDIDESALDIGAGLMAYLAAEELAAVT